MTKNYKSFEESNVMNLSRYGFRVFFPGAVMISMFVFSMFVLGQNERPIFGEISSISGMTKVYVEGATSDERKMILAQFKRDKTFTVVGDPADAEFFMSFGELTRQAVATLGRSQYQERDEAEVYYLKGSKKVVVWQDTETLDVSNGMSFSFPNSVNLTRNFIKAYKKASKL